MNTRRHETQVELPVPPTRAFRALHTPSEICAWWSASRAIVMPETGGLWVAVWGDADDPDYIGAATLTVFDPPRRLMFGDYRYRDKSGPLPFKADLTTEFALEPSAGGSLLRVVQAGFPVDAAADAFYAACETGWHNTLESLRAFLAANPN